MSKKINPKELEHLPDWKRDQILKQQKKKLKKSNKRKDVQYGF